MIMITIANVDVLNLVNVEFEFKKNECARVNMRKIKNHGTAVVPHNGKMQKHCMESSIRLTSTHTWQGGANTWLNFHAKIQQTCAAQDRPKPHHYVDVVVGPSYATWDRSPHHPAERWRWRCAAANPPAATVTGMQGEPVPMRLESRRRRALKDDARVNDREREACICACEHARAQVTTQRRGLSWRIPDIDASIAPHTHSHNCKTTK
jgi:hypothetical protein